METTPKNRKTAWLLLTLYGFNLAGMLIWPDQWHISSSQRFKFASLIQLLYYVGLLTALPVAALALAAFRTPHKVLAGLFVAISGFAIFPAVVIAALSLPTFAKITMIATLNFSVLCLIAAMALAKKDIQKSQKFRFLLGAATLLPAWSILSGPMLYGQAALTANGLPYCVAFPSASNARAYTPDIGFWALRGIALAAEETQGGSESYQFSFHALLFIEDSPEFWNWSKTTLSFEPIKHPELWPDLRIACATELTLQNASSTH